MSRVHIVGQGFDAYVRMFKKAGHDIVEDIAQADLVQFTGGADVDPILYGRLEHKKTKPQFDRDRAEVAAYATAKGLGKPIAGICRGAQFLCVMAGHELWQHVSDHATGVGHHVTDKITRAKIFVTSTHHQMMRLNDKGGEAVVIATAGHRAKEKCAVEEDGFAWTYEDKDDKGEDLEVVFFPKEKSLAFQGHPEFAKDECRHYYFQLLNQYLGFR